MQSKAKSVREYLAELPEERRKAIAAVRDVIRANLPEGYREGMGYGMISYHVPHSVYPPGYHCDPSQPLPFAGLGSQKNHMALYLMCVYGDPTLERWFREAWTESGKKLDMGKSCVRFRKLEDLPLEVIGQLIRKVPVKKLIERYEEAIARPSPARAKGKRKTPSRSAAASKKTPARKAKPRSKAPRSRTRRAAT